MPQSFAARAQRLWRKVRRIKITRAHLPGLALVLAVVLGTLLTLPRPQNPAPGAPSGPIKTAVKIGGPFALIGPDGSTVTDQSFPGKYLLVFFGYTFCPDVCPTTLTNVAAALDKLGPLADRIQPLFITVDPGRDTPEVMASYVGHFDTRIIGLTGRNADIEAVEKAYRVYAAPQRTGDGPNDYLMDHSAMVYLMNPGGDFVATLDHAASGDELAKDIKAVLAP